MEFSMDLRKLKTLIDLVSESDISELEVTEGEDKVKIVKNTPNLNSIHSLNHPAMHIPFAASAMATPAHAINSSVEPTQTPQAGRPSK